MLKSDTIVGIDLENHEKEEHKEVEEEKKVDEAPKKKEEKASGETSTGKKNTLYTLTLSFPLHLLKHKIDM